MVLIQYYCLWLVLTESSSLKAGDECTLILSRPKTLPFWARLGNGRLSIPPWGSPDYHSTSLMMVSLSNQSPGGAPLLVVLLRGYFADF